ncbi:MAG: hypothetical protein ISR95_08900, partial [Candidatus Marinimicrobia bacterium]|nr:hypothetical protein [Candidatus Neomarinimicrobiota bacterium]
MSNSCVPDIFSCTGQGSDGLQDKGYLYPISHVFSRQEVEDLDNPTQMPEQYYSYIKKEGTKKRRALSLTDPTSFTDYDSGGTTPIKSNNNSVLDRIKTYRIKANPDTDMKAFIVVDPKFYNLREYIDSGNAFYGNRAGTYNTGYNQFDSEGKRVLTYKTCPILGLTGYSGICDPDQKAGCNVPIYGVGSQTYFDHIDENLTLTYTDYPVIWSGYVKEWAWISRQQYFENIEGRIGKFGGRLYLDNEDEDEPNVKEGPIFMVTRSDDYCSERETYTGRLYDPESKRLPCIQYYQYQETAGEGDSKEYRFLNLFSPEPDLRANPDYAFSSLISYNIVNGMAKYDEPVAGADFLSRETPNYIERIEDDEVSRPARGQQIYDTDESRINATDGNQTIGNYRGDDSSSGAGIGIRQGVRDGLRLKVPAGADTTGISSRCAIVDNRRTDPNNENVFIPTNSHSELQSFLSAAEANQVDEMSARNCIPSYETFDHYQRTVKGVASPPPNPNGSLTWIGNLRCSDLKLDKKPACNQTVLLTAQRTCLLEDGLAGDCTDCLNARVFDPDANVILNDETVGGEVLSGPDYPGRPNMCYFSALCYNLSSKGCPGAGTSGGHVF